MIHKLLPTQGDKQRLCEAHIKLSQYVLAGRFCHKSRPKKTLMNSAGQVEL